MSHELNTSFSGASYLSDENYDISENILTAWCNFINEDLEKLGRPPMDAIEIRLHLRPIGSPESGKRYTPLEHSSEGNLVKLCFPEDDEKEYDKDEVGSDEL
jgi:hypothetical protein